MDCDNMLITKQQLLDLGFREQRTNQYKYFVGDWYGIILELSSDETDAEEHWTIYPIQIDFMPSATITTMNEVIDTLVHNCVKLGADIANKEMNESIKRTDNKIRELIG